MNLQKFDDKMFPRSEALNIGQFDLLANERYKKVRNSQISTFFLENHRKNYDNFDPVWYFMEKA